MLKLSKAQKVQCEAIIAASDNAHEIFIEAFTAYTSHTGPDEDLNVLRNGALVAQELYHKSLVSFATFADEADPDFVADFIDKADKRPDKTWCMVPLT